MEDEFPDAEDEKLLSDFRAAIKPMFLNSAMCDSEFKDMPYSNEIQAQLAKDELPWLNVAKQVIAGKFNGADDSMLKSINIGLRSIDHPLCKKALESIKENLD